MIPPKDEYDGINWKKCLTVAPRLFEDELTCFFVFDKCHDRSSREGAVNELRETFLLNCCRLPSFY